MSRSDDLRALRKARHAAAVEMLRDGRRNRSQTFRSGREYRRRGKHPDRYDT